MHRSQKRTLIVLIVLLAVLLIALAVVVTVQHSQEEAAQQAAAAEEAASVITPVQTYTAITYDNGSATLSFHVDEETGSWVWSDDPEFPLDQSFLTSMTELLTSLRPQQTITDGDTLEAYGLDAPFASLTATAQDGSTLTLQLGNATTDGNSYYMLMDGDESTVYIIDGTLYSSYMSKAIYDLCDLPELPGLTEDTISTITLQGAVTTTLQAQRTEESVSWTSGGEDVTGLETVDALLTELGALSVDRCVDFKPTDEAAAICGFDAPTLTLTVAYETETGTEETLVLTIGAQTLEADGRYVRIGEDTTIYQMSAADLETLLSVAANGLSA